MSIDDSRENSFSSPFVNRELSWIDFNERVLEEGLKKDLPPLERFKFLSIVSSNFDEFFMVRVAAIKQTRQAGGGTDPSGLSPAELLEKISRKVHSINDRQFNALVNEVFPSLAQGGLSLLRPIEWSAEQREYLESLFVREFFPLLTPLRLGTPTDRSAAGLAEAKETSPLEEEAPLPSIENYSLYAAFLLEEAFVQSRMDRNSSPPAEHISIVRIPPTPERIVWLSGETLFPSNTGQRCWALLEDLVQVYGASFFPGYKVKESLVFKVNRDADFSVDEKRDEDFIVAMAEMLEGRGRSMPVRMVYSPGSNKIRDYLARRLCLEEDDLYEVAGPLNLGNLYDLILHRGFDHLREKPWEIYSHPVLHEDQPLWDRIRAGDIYFTCPTSPLILWSASFRKQRQTPMWRPSKPPSIGRAGILPSSGPWNRRAFRANM